LAANRARIEQLWIYPTEPLRSYEEGLRATLASRWDGVAVTIGEPPYAQRDRATMQSPISMATRFRVFPPDDYDIPIRVSTTYCRANSASMSSSVNPG
jgi:hypothetical protein